MLHLESVEGDTLGLLKKLMTVECLSNFNLVGGTALALRYGHRLSVDLDLFATEPFDNNLIYNELISIFPSLRVSTLQSKVGIFGFIDDVKVDFIQYFKFPLIDEVQVVDGVRIVSDADIAAMKIFAILQRAKKKDFFDLSLLLDNYGLDQIIKWYQKKYAGNLMLISIPTAMPLPAACILAEMEPRLSPMTTYAPPWRIP
jgi:predicted nucleotidyltransferase component of viral defense system